MTLPKPHIARSNERQSVTIPNAELSQIKLSKLDLMTTLPQCMTGLFAHACRAHWHLDSARASCANRTYGQQRTNPCTRPTRPSETYCAHVHKSTPRGLKVEGANPLLHHHCHPSRNHNDPSTCRNASPSLLLRIITFAVISVALSDLGGLPSCPKA